MKKLVFLILILALSGCVSRKTAVKENIKLDAVENVDKTEKTVESAAKVDKVVKEAKTSIADKTVTRTIETEYSTPDASGNQHKTKEKTTETRNDVQTVNEANERTISEQKTQIERLTVDNSELRTKLNASLSERKSTTTKLPFLVYIASFVIGFVTALILRQWIKTKFRL